MFGKQRNGQTVINDALHSFNSAIEQLDEGIALCEHEEKDLQEDLEDTQRSLATVGRKKARALNVKENIKKLLSA